MTTEHAGLKIVVKLAPGAALIGVEAEGCDPVFETAPTGDLAEVLQHVPAVVTRARGVWQERRQGPAYQAPTPPPAPPRAQPTQPASTRGRAKPAPEPEAAQPVQQSLM